MLQPAITLLNRLDYAKKFLLIGGILSIPLLYLAYSTFVDIQHKAQLSEQQSYGISTLTTLRLLPEYIAQSRGMINAKNYGDNSFDSAILERQAYIQRTFDSLLSHPSNHPAFAALHPSLRTLYQRWHAIKASQDSMPADETFAAYSQLIANSLDLINDLGEQSGLLLNTQSQDYYLSRITLVLIPRLAEYLGQVRGLGAGILTRRARTADEQVQLMFTLSHIQDYYGQLNRAIMRLNRNQPNQGKQISQYTEQNHRLIQEFIVSSRSLLLSDSISRLEPSLFFDQGTQSIDSLFILLHKTMQQLHSQVSANQRKFGLQRWILLIGLGLTYLLTIYLFLGLYRAVTSSLQQLQALTTDMAAGNLAPQININSKDELATIGHFLNNIRQQWLHIIQATQDASRHVNQRVFNASDSINQVCQDAIQQNADNKQLHHQLSQLYNNIQTLRTHSQQNHHHHQVLQTNLTHCQQTLQHLRQELRQNSPFATPTAGDHQYSEGLQQLSDAIETMVQNLNMAEDIDQRISAGLDQQNVTVPGLRKGLESSNLLAQDVLASAQDALKQTQALLQASALLSQHVQRFHLTHTDNAQDLGSKSDDSSNVPVSA